MSPDDTFVASRSYDELATEAIARGRRIRRRRALVQRALPATALVIAVALGVSASVGGDQSGLDVQVTDRQGDRQGEDPGDPGEPDPRTGESEAPPGTPDNYAPSMPAPSQGSGDRGSSPLGGTGSVAGSATPATSSRTVAFIGSEEGRTAVFVANPNGSDARRLTSGPGNSFWPTWSRDGSRLAFYNDRDGTNRIYVVGADGRGEDLLVDLGNDHATQPAWSPVEDVVAFTRFARPVAQTTVGPTTQKGIWVVRADGTELRQVVASASAQPAWSPDGEELAFVDAESALRVVDVASGKVRTVAASANVPQWSPDGRRLAFGRVVDGREQLFVVNADGSGERRIVSSDAYDSLPEWSPDGESIVFSRDPDGRAGTVSCTSLESCGAGGAGPSGLWVVSSSGGQPEPFIATTGRADSHCRFSPR